MNDRRSPEQLLSAWFDSEAPSGAPDALRADVITATARTRPRPTWLARLKGNHMDVIAGGADRRQTRLIPILIVLGLVLALGAAVVYVGSRPPTTPTVVNPSPSPTAAASLPATARPTATPAPTPISDDAIELPYTVLQVIVGDDAIWVSVAGEDTDERLRAIYRVDPTSRDATLVVDDLPLASTDIATFTQTGDFVFVSDDRDRLGLRYDASTGELLGEVPLGDMPIDPYVAFGDVWHPNYQDGTITRLDGATGAVVATIVIEAFNGQGPLVIAEGTDLVWALAPRVAIVGIDPATNEVVETLTIDTLRCGLGVKADRLWLGGCQSNDLDVYDEASLAFLGSVDVPGNLFPPLPDFGEQAWVVTHPGDGQDGTTVLTEVDPATLAVGSSLDLGAAVNGPVVAFDSLWYAKGATLYRLSLDALPPG
jgi:hypothetical protein